MDVRAVIDTVVQSIRPYDALEQHHIDLTRAWIASGAQLYRLSKPATPPQHLVPYCSLYDSATRQLLLVDHVNAGLWLPCGGHVEPAEDPRATAMRELREELGLEARLLFPHPIFLTVTQTVGTSAGHTDVSLWYVMYGDCEQPLCYDHAEFNQVAWFALDNLPLQRTDPHLIRFAQKLSVVLGVDF